MRLFLTIFFLALTLPSFSHAASERYTGQTQIKCNNTEIPVPRFAPLSNENLFIKNDGNCGSDHFEMFIGIGQDCERQQMCYLYFFSKEKLNTGYIHSALDEIFGQGLEEIELAKNINGYYIPSRVFAYPTPERIIWIDQHYLYVIGQKGGGKDDLIKAANSLLIPQ